MARTRRLALRTYAALPEWVRLQLVRRLTPDYTVGALCFVECGGRVLMLRQHHREGWTLPGGLLDRGEGAADAVRRELHEETGLNIAPGEPLTCVVDPTTQRVDVLFRIPVTQRPDVVPRSEAIEAAWLLPSELGEVDTSTRQAFAASLRVQQADARTGRLAGRPAATTRDSTGVRPVAAIENPAAEAGAVGRAAGRTIYFAAGCSRDAERALRLVTGVTGTVRGRLGDTEVVRVDYDPARLTTRALVEEFWQLHDPTAAPQPGCDDRGWHRSGLYWTTQDQASVYAVTRAAVAARLAASSDAESSDAESSDAGAGAGADIVTEARSAAEAGPFLAAD